MSLVKKVFIAIPVGLLLSPLILSCGDNNNEYTYLRVLNSEDYIDTSVITDFENEYNSSHPNSKKVKVVYDTFDTMENMFNTLKTGKTKYDLVCASEYMIQKLYKQDLIKEINKNKVPHYFEESSNNSIGSKCSPFISKKLSSVEFADNKTLFDYTVCYMWGTLGILYNPKYESYQSIGEKQVKQDVNASYGVLWDNKYKRTISIKDSMRDTYAIGLLYNQSEKFKDEKTSDNERNAIFNWGGEDDDNAKEHINMVKKSLLSLRENIFGFEVDSGKEDIVTGKIGMNTAWSGDAIYSMNEADEEGGATLYYAIPEEGGNLWFDCWSQLKTSSSDDEACAFLDYMSRPENAIRNMKKIGYTSAIAGGPDNNEESSKDNDIFSYFNDKYQDESGTDSYDIGYFFKQGNNEQDYKIQINKNSDKPNRQLGAQLPSLDTTKKLMIMKDYGNNNDLIMKMWEEVKHETLPTWAIVLFVIEITAILGGAVFLIAHSYSSKKRRKLRRKSRV